MFVVKFNKSCIVTYIGVIFGLLAIYFAITNAYLFHLKGTTLSMMCLMLSGVCDMFDGKFARMFKRSQIEKEMGVQMDSLADTICFLVVPVIYMISLNMVNPIYLLIDLYLLIGGITRLAYFNVAAADTEKAIKCYNGLPVTTTAIFYPLIGFLNLIFKFNNLEIILAIVTLIIAFLFNFKIKIPKFGTKTNILILILAIIFLVLFVII